MCIRDRLKYLIVKWKFGFPQKKNNKRERKGDILDINNIINPLTPVSAWLLTLVDFTLSLEEQLVKQKCFASKSPKGLLILTETKTIAYNITLHLVPNFLECDQSAITT